MSLDFRANRTETNREERRSRYERMIRSRCPECRGIHRNYAAPEDLPRHDCDTCLGYGSDPEVEREVIAADARDDGPSLNVSTDNGAALLRVLGVPECEIAEFAGSMDPSTLLLRIAMAEALPAAVAREARQDERLTRVVLTADGVDEEECGYSFGLDAETISDRYLPALRRIAEVAVDEGVNVIWD